MPVISTQLNEGISQPCLMSSLTALLSPPRPLSFLTWQAPRSSLRIIGQSDTLRCNLRSLDLQRAERAERLVVSVSVIAGQALGNFLWWVAF